MIVEMRTYSFVAGGLSTFFSAYDAGPMEIQKRILGNLLGYYVTETGTLNQTVHLWGYDNADERLARRSELAADPQWVVFLREILPLITRQESVLLTPTTFSP